MAIGCFAGFTGFDCSILWIILIVLFFAAAIIRKNIAGELLDMEFSLIGGTCGGAIVFIVMMYITHSMKWGSIIGLIGVFIGGFVGAQFLPDVEGSSGGGDGGWF